MEYSSEEQKTSWGNAFNPDSGPIRAEDYTAEYTYYFDGTNAREEELYNALVESVDEDNSNWNFIKKGNQYVATYKW